MYAIRSYYVPLDQLTPEQAAALESLFGEFEAVLRRNADLPGEQLQLGVFLANRGVAAGAEAASYNFV